MARGGADYTPDDRTEQSAVIAVATRCDRVDDTDGSIRCRAYVASIAAAVARLAADTGARECSRSEERHEDDA
jgi:hypothetical protein